MYSTWRCDNRIAWENEKSRSKSLNETFLNLYRSRYRFLKVLMEYGSRAEFLKTEDVANAVLFAINQPFNCAVNSILLEPIGAPIWTMVETFWVIMSFYNFSFSRLCKEINFKINKKNQKHSKKYFVAIYLAILLNLSKIFEQLEWFMVSACAYPLG